MQLHINSQLVRHANFNLLAHFDFEAIFGNQQFVLSRKQDRKIVRALAIRYGCGLSIRAGIDDSHGRPGNHRPVRIGYFACYRTSELLARSEYKSQ